MHQWSLLSPPSAGQRLLELMKRGVAVVSLSIPNLHFLKARPLNPSSPVGADLGSNFQLVYTSNAAVSSSDADDTSEPCNDVEVGEALISGFCVDLRPDHRGQMVL